MYTCMGKNNNGFFYCRLNNTTILYVNRSAVFSIQNSCHFMANTVVFVFDPPTQNAISKFTATLKANVGYTVQLSYKIKLTWGGLLCCLQVSCKLSHEFLLSSLATCKQLSSTYMDIITRVLVWGHYQ